jgi:hypothetical protein
MAHVEPLLDSRKFSGEKAMNRKLMRAVAQSAQAYWWLMVLYIASSFIQMFPFVSVAILLNTDLGCEASDLAFYYAAVFIPWNLRAVYGLVSDIFPILGSRRKPYLLVCYIGIGACLVVFGQAVVTLKDAYIVGILLNFFFAFSESVVDAISVDLVSAAEESEETPLRDRVRRSTDIQSAAMTFRTIGSLVAVPMAGSLSGVLSPRTLISATAVFPMIAIVVSFVVEIEHPGMKDVVHKRTLEVLMYIRRNIRERVFPREIVNTITPVLLPCVFVLLYASCPSSNIPFSNYLLTKLNFSKGEYHAISLCGTIGGLLGTLLYWKLLRNTLSIRLGFVVSICLNFLTTSSRLLIIYELQSIYFVCFDEMLVNAALRLTLMPVQIYGSLVASSPANQAFEGLVFGIFVSVENWGGTLSGIFCGLLSPHLSLTALIIITACIGFVPLLALALLKPPTLIDRVDQETNVQTEVHNI